jgi:hypothetical protein
LNLTRKNRIIKKFYIFKMRSLIYALVIFLTVQSSFGFLFHMDDEPLLVGSFNIQSLGPTKMSRPEFRAATVRILARYDIVLIQEIKDSTEKNSVFNYLIDELNEFVRANGSVYSFAISPRLGKSSSYKEQKAFLYK